MADYDDNTTSGGPNNIALAIRDKVRELRRKYPYSDAMIGTIDPYSGQPIRNREDYEDYLTSYASAPFTQWNKPVVFAGKSSQSVDVPQMTVDQSRADSLPQNNNPSNELPTKPPSNTWPQIKRAAGKDEAMVFDNPFYILSALPSDDRKRITQLCDEKSLSQNADKCIEARNTLTNPQKRLAAELRWFMGCQPSTTSELLAYIVQLRDGVKDEAQPAITQNSIADLNLHLAALLYWDIHDIKRLQFEILAISRLFNQLDIGNLMLLINASRKAASIPQVNSKSDVEAAISALRGDIRNIITKVLSSLPQPMVTTLLTSLIRQYSDNKRYNGNIIIEDLTSWYTLFIHDLEDKMKQAIQLELKTIENSPNRSNLKAQLDTLVKHIQNWDNLVQPIQLLAQSQGSSHDASEQLFAQMRDFSLKINNDWLLPELSLMLTQSLKDIFAELPEAALRINEDIKKLTEITDEKAKIEEETRRRETHFRTLEKKYENDQNNRFTVETSSNSIQIPKRCLSCCKPTDQEEQVRGITFYMCPECQNKRTEARKVRAGFTALRSKKVRRAVALTVVLSLLLTAIAVFVLRLYNIEQFYAVIVVLVAPSFLFFILGGMVHISSAVPGYLRVEDALEDPLLSISSYKNFNSSIFSFANGVYAELFADANKVKVKPVEVVPPRNSLVHLEKAKLRILRPSASGEFALLILISIMAVALFGQSYNSIPTGFVPKEFKSAIGAIPTAVPKPTVTPKPTIKPTSKPTAKPTAQLREVTKPANGSTYYYTGTATKNSLVKIIVPTGSNYYMVTMAYASSKKKAVQIFAYPGKTVEVEIPSGTYRLYYTYGPTWYGVAEQFGPNAPKARSEDTDIFTNGTSWTYTLYAVTGGNMETESVSNEDYPI